jgi:hypothetical protein
MNSEQAGILACYFRGWIICSYSGHPDFLPSRQQLLKFDREIVGFDQIERVVDH